MQYLVGKFPLSIDVFLLIIFQFSIKQTVMYISDSPPCISKGIYTPIFVRGLSFTYNSFLIEI